MKHTLPPLPFAFLAASLVAVNLSNADTFVWSSPTGGDFEEAANWRVNNAIPATCPGAGDSILFCAGTYTVILAADHTVAAIDLSTGETETREWDGHDVFFPTINLGKHTLTATDRIDVSLRTPQYWNENPEEFGSLTFINGTVVCNGSLMQCGDEAVNNTSATGFGAGVCWGQNWFDRVRGHLVIGDGATANVASAFVMGYNSGIRVTDGGALHVSGWMQSHHRALEHLSISGTGTTVSIDTFNVSGQPKTNVVENGANASFGQIRWGYWWGEGGNALVVRSGATLSLSRQNEWEAFAEQTDNIHDSLVLVTGEGSTLAIPENSVFQFGNKNNNVNQTLRVENGGAVRGPQSSRIIIGRGPGCTGNCLDVDNGTIEVGKIHFGDSWQVWDFSPDGPYYGYSSNGLFRISGSVPSVHVTSQSWDGGGHMLFEGTVNLDFDTTLQFDIPATGWASAPLLIDSRLWTAPSTIPGYENAPSCRLVVNPLDFGRARPGMRVILVETAIDSTAAFDTLIANASLGDAAGTAFAGELSIEDNGCKLVYRAPNSNTTVILLR